MMTQTSGVSFLTLLVPMLLVFAVILSIAHATKHLPSKGGSGLRRGGTTLLMMLMVLGTLFWFRLGRSHVTQPATLISGTSWPVTEHVAATPEIGGVYQQGAVYEQVLSDHDLSSTVRRRLSPEQKPSTDTSAWDENVAPVANIYPGIAECGRPLAAKLVKHLQREINLNDGEPTAEAEAVAKYRVALKNSGLDQPDYLNFLIRFRKEFTSSFPGSFVDDMTAGSYPTPKDTEKEKQYQRLPVTVYSLSDGRGSVAKWEQPGSNRTIERSGQMVCQLRRNGKLGQVEFVSDFIEKPWVADAEKFVSQHPKRKLIIGFSNRLARSEQEARVGAFADVDTRLLNLQQKMFMPNYDKERNVLDRFVQKLTMPYGSVWREAVLIDYGLHDTELWKTFGNANTPFTARRLVDGGKLVAGEPVLRTRKGTSAVARPAKEPSSESMIAGLMFLTVCVGLISNWMTQGYYRKPVWTVTGTAFTIGFVVLLLVVLVNVA